MKKIISYLILLLINYFPCQSQEIINNSRVEPNEAIKQIRTSGIDNITSFQALNRGFSNNVLTWQTGNENKVGISQQTNSNLAMGNQSFTVQTGTSNELSLGQIGTGNVLLGFQLGYLASQTGGYQGSQTEMESGIAPALFPTLGNRNLVGGEGNKLNISQEGSSNSIMAIQQGSYNSITAQQKGKNNYLSVLQVGTNNAVIGYKQGNESELTLFETVIQLGDHLSLITDGVPNSTPAVNRFTQRGTNLSLQLNSSLLNTGAGVEVNQTGRDMKVVVDQSYFSFPFGKP